MKQIFLSLILLFSLHNAHGQTATTEKRLEFEFNDDFKGGGVIEYGKDGFLLISTSKDQETGEWSTHYNKYNSNFEKVGEKIINPEKNHFTISSATVGGKSYSIQTIRRKKKSRPFKLITYDFFTQEISSVSGILPDYYALPSEFKVINDWMFCNVSIKRINNIMAFNVKTGEVKTIPIILEGVKPKNMVLNNLQVFDSNDEVVMTFNAAIKARFKTLIVRLDNNFNIKDFVNISDGQAEIINNATVSKLENDKYIITGTYAAKIPETSTGIYFATIENMNVKSINYYSFTKFENFFNYLTEKQQERVEKKIDRAESNDKELNLRYNISIHNIIKVNEDYLFLGEAYYPVYHYERTTTYTNGKPVTTTKRVFDGFRYTHAVYAKFNKEGELLWDQCFEMTISEMPKNVKRFIKVADGTQENLNLVYVNGSDIVNKIVDFNGKTVSEKKSSVLETGKEGDIEKYTYQLITPWFENYFISYGEQKLKNMTDEDVKKKRIVFFINKIKF